MSEDKQLDSIWTASIGIVGCTMMLGIWSMFLCACISNKCLEIESILVLALLGLLIVMDYVKNVKLLWKAYKKRS